MISLFLSSSLGNKNHHALLEMIRHLWHEYLLYEGIDELNLASQTSSSV